MRNFILLLILALLGAGFYGYHINPTACIKLGNDVVTDVTTIYSPILNAVSSPSGTNTEPASTTTETQTGQPPQTRHFQQGFATPDAPSK